MTQMKYFSDYGGDAIELAVIQGMRNAEFVERFPGIKGKRSDSFSMWVGYEAGSREPLPLTRRIAYKSHPSKHVCDSRCMHARGKTMSCECSCGGANHGRSG